MKNILILFFFFSFSNVFSASINLDLGGSNVTKNFCPNETIAVWWNGWSSCPLTTWWYSLDKGVTWASVPTSDNHSSTPDRQLILYNYTSGVYLKGSYKSGALIKFTPIAIFLNYPVVETTITNPYPNVCPTGQVTLSVPQNSAHTYQWLSSRSFSGPYSNVSDGEGGTTSSYTTPNLASSNYYYKCTVTRTSSTLGNCAATSDPTLISVGYNASVSINPNDNFCTSYTKPLSATVSYNIGTVSYQWKKSSNPTTGFVNCSGNSTSSTYNFSQSTAGTTYIRCYVSQTIPGCVTVNSNSSAFNVSAQPVLSTLTPNLSTLCTGGSTTLSTTASGGLGTNSYTWEMSSNNSTFVAANGSVITDGMYATGSLSSDKYYRCILSQTGLGCGPVTSNSALITVVSDPTATTPSGGTICSGGTFTLSTTASGGVSPFSYQWQQSSNNSTFTNVTTGTGANSASYTTAALTSNTYYRCVISQNCSGCDAITTSSALVSVVGDPSVSITAGETMCTSGSKSLSSSLSGGTGIISYQWQESSDNVMYNDISGASNTTYSYIAANEGTKYIKLKVTMNGTGCDVAYSSPAVFTVVAKPIVANPTAATICSGGSASLNVAASGGAGTFSYQWQYSTDNSNFYNVTDGTGSNTASYTTAALTANKYYKCLVSQSGLGCTTNTPSSALVTVNADLSASTPTSATICVGGTQALSTSVSGGAGTTSYQWQISSNGGTSFSNVSDGSGGNTANYTTASLAGTRLYRCYVSNTGNGCDAVYTGNSTVTVNSDPTATITSGETICTAGTKALTASYTGGAGTASYIWQTSTDNNTFVNISGATNISYSFSQSNAGTTYLRCVVNTNASGCDASSSSSSAIIVVNQPSNSNPSPASICSGGTNSLSVSASGGTGTFSYQWQGSTNNVNFTNVTDGTGGTSSSYTSAVLTSNKYYRCLISQNGTGCNSITSNSALVTVNADPSGTNPSAGFICTNGNLTLTTTASGGAGTMSYQWQESTNNSTFTNVSTGTGYTTSLFTSPSLTANKYYRCYITNTGNGCDAYTTNSALVTVNADPVATINSGTTVCISGTQGFSASYTGGAGTASYQWQNSSDNLNFNNISNATNSSYTFTGSTAGTSYYRCIVSTANPGCDASTSNSSTMIVVSQPTVSNPVAGEICPSGTKTLNVSASGGAGTFNYQWQGSTDNTSFTNVTDGTGGTSSSYTTAALTANKYYRCYVSQTGTGCNNQTTSPALVTVRNIQPGTVASDQTICYNSDVAAFTSSAAASGVSNNIIYTWQQTTNSTLTPGAVGWSDISSSNSVGYDYGNLTETNYFVRKATDATCNISVYSNKLGVTVRSQLNGGSIGSDQTICYNTVPVQFSNVSAASGGANNFTYTWQYTTDPNLLPGASGWTDVAGSNLVSYTAPTLTQTRYYIRKAIDGTCLGSVYSNKIAITVLPATSAGIITPLENIICYNSNTSIDQTLPTGNKNTMVYNWKYSTDGGSTWLSLTGVNTPSINTNSLIVNTKFKRIVTDGSGCFGTGLESNVATITVLPETSPGTITPQVTPVCYNASTNIDQTLPAGNKNTIAYSWKYSTDGSTWLNVTGASLPTLNTGNLPVTTNFKRIVTDGSGCFGTGLESNVATVTVIPVVVGSVGSDQTICNNSIPGIFTSNSTPTGGIGAFTYLWQKSTDNGTTWADISGATSTTYSEISALSQVTQYRRKETNATCGSYYSNIVTVTNSPITAGEVGFDQTILPNSMIEGFTNLKSPICNIGSFSYQWERNGGSSWSALTGATDATYAESGFITTNQKYRRREVNSLCGTSYSNEINITVSPITSGTISADQTICQNTKPAKLNNVFLPSGGVGGFTYQWQKQEITDNTFRDIIGATSDSYTETSNLTKTTYYRRKEINNGTAFVYSNIVKITIDPLVAGGVGSSQTICYNTKPLTLTSSSVPTGGVGAFTYQWQSSNDGVFFTDLLASTNNYYVENNNLTQKTYYQRKDINSCGIVTSNIIIVDVAQDVNPGTIGFDQTSCYNAKPEALTDITTASGGISSYTYQWQKSTDGTNFTDIPTNATGTSYNEINNLTANTWYRRKVTNTCKVSYTTPVKVTIAPNLVQGAISADQSICYNTSPVLFANQTTPTGGIGDFTYIWQRSFDDGFTYSDITITNNLTYKDNSNLTTRTLYRRKEVNACGTKYSNYVTVTVANPVVSGLVGPNQNICYNTKPTTLANQSLPSGGIGAFSYQWQKSTDDGFNYVLLDAATGSSASEPSNLTSSAKYRRMETNTCGITYSNVINVTVGQPILSGQVYSDQSICMLSKPNSFNSSVTPSGGIGSWTFQWAYMENGQSSWNYLPVLTTSCTDDRILSKTTQYKRIETNTCGTVNSNIVTVTVGDYLAGGTISGSQNICYGTSPSIYSNVSLPTGGKGTYIYQWEKSIDNGINWSNITGAVNSSFKDNMPYTQSTLIRRREMNDCGTVYSNEILVQVYQVTSNNTITGDQNVCYSGTASRVNGSSVIGGSGTVVFSWQNSDDASNWFDIASSNSLNYNPGVLTEPKYYRRIVSSGNCPVITSNSVYVNVYDQLTGGEITDEQAICYNASPDTIKVSSPTGGINTYTYEWYSSSDGTNFSKVIGASARYYKPNPLTSNTYFKRKTTSGSCGSVESNSIQVEVYPQLNPAVIGNSQNICNNTKPVQLSGAIATGGNGSFSYSWYVSTDSASFDLIPSTNNIVFAPDALTSTKFYKRVATNNLCGSVSSNIVKVNVYNPLTSGTISSDQTVCYNSSPAKLVGSSPTGATGTYTYQWQSSNDGTVYNDVIGAVSNDYTPGNLTSSVFYKKKVSSGSCGSVYTNPVFITVNPQLLPGNPSSAQTICYNTIPSELSVTGHSGGTGVYSFQWQKSSDAVSWQNIPEGLDANFTAPSLTTTTFYRRLVVDGTCGNSPSASIKVTVYPQLTAGTISSNQSICYGSIPETINGTTSSGGSGIYSYIWQSKTSSTDWTNIDNETSKDLNLSSLTKTTLFRRKTINACNEVNSNDITINVYNDVDGGEIGPDQFIAYNTTPVLLVSVVSPSGGPGSFTYQWKYSTDGSSWSNVTSSNTDSYQPGNLLHTTYYKRIATSSCGSSESNVLTILVYPSLNPGTIGSSQFICYNTQPDSLLEISSPSGGDGIYSYQWQKSADNINWTDITDATDFEFRPDNLSENTWFRRKILSNIGGSKYSNSIKITVYSQLLAGVISENEVLCYGETSSSIITYSPPSGGYGEYLINWEFSPDNLTWESLDWSFNYYSPGIITSSQYYRKTVSNNCGVSYSNVVSKTIYPDINGGSIGSDQYIAYNSTPEQIENSSYPTGGNGAFSYKWQYSTDQVSWVDKVGATSATFQPAALLKTTCFKRVASNSCGDGESNFVTIYVYPQLSGGTIGLSQSICNNSQPELLFETIPVSGGDENYSYQWQHSIDGTNWTDITGETYSTYQPGNLMQTTFYRRKVTATIGGSAFSNAVQVTIFSTLSAGTIGNTQNICFKTIPVELTGSLPTGGSGNYLYQWQSKSTLTNWTNISEANSPNFQPASLPASLSFRRNVSDGCLILSSNEITVSVYDSLKGGSVGPDQYIAYNSTPSLLSSVESPSGGTGTYTYKWKYSTDQSTWNDKAGATSETLQPTLQTVSTYYKRIAINTCGTVESNLVSLIVYPSLTGGTIGSDQSICFNSLPETLTNITLPTGGDESYSYIWQFSTNNIDWSDIYGAYVLDYSPVNLKVNTWFRRKVFCAVGGEAYSNSIKITVYPEFVAASIGNPQSICYNFQPAAIVSTILPTGGNGTVWYQWQTYTNTGLWTNIEGAINKDYLPGQLIANSSYRQISGNSCGQDTSNQVYITVYNNFVPGVIGNDQTLAFNSVPDQFVSINAPTGGTEIYSYQWQKSPNQTEWSDIQGATSNTYQSVALTTPEYFRRKEVDFCGTLFSNSIFVNVYPELLAGSIGSNQTICHNSLPSNLTEQTPATGGNSFFVYSWYSSTDGTNWDLIPIVNTLSYQPGYLTDNQFFKRRVTSFGTYAESNSIKITVREKIPSIVVETKDFYCKGDAVSLQAKGITGDYTWLDNLGAPVLYGTTFTIDKLLTDAQYYVFLENSYNCFSDSTLVDLKIDPVKSDFTTDLQNIDAGTPIRFSNLSSDAKTYVWNFGDNTDVSTEISPWHYYNDVGSFDVSLISISANNCYDTLIVPGFITVKLLGVSDNSVNLSVYPNPATNKLFVESEQEISIFLLSDTGQLLFNSTGFKNYQVDLSTYNQGVYFLKTITANNSIHLTKIVKL